MRGKIWHEIGKERVIFYAFTCCMQFLHLLIILFSDLMKNETFLHSIFPLIFFA